MTKFFLSKALVGGCILASAVAACVNTGNVKTERVDGVEWHVTVYNVVEFNDSVLNVGTDYNYSVADTAAVNAALKELKHCNNMRIGWTLPASDGTIWLVAYNNEPIMSEAVHVSAVNSIPEYNGDVQAVFQFPDAKRWAEITADNIGRRLAISVNGQLMNAPQVNTEITSGNCSVVIPSALINNYL